MHYSMPSAHLILLQMAKSWYLAAFVIALSLLWPYFFTSSTEKELRKEVTDKGQQIIELLKERVGREKEISV